jgi:hypothetical protein
LKKLPFRLAWHKPRLIGYGGFPVDEAQRTMIGSIDRFLKKLESGAFLVGHAGLIEYSEFLLAFSLDDVGQ